MPDHLTNEQVRELAGKVAAEMGWQLDRSVKPDCYFHVITGPDGVQVGMQRARESGKLYITGHYPRDSHYYFRNGEHGHIRVSVSRGPAVIGREITRRLLPTVVATTAKIRQYDAQEQSETASRMALVDRITRLLAGIQWHMPGHCQSDRRSQIIVSLPDLGGGHLDFLSDGHEVTFERFRVPAETAVRMLAVLTAEPTSEAVQVAGQLEARAETYASDARKFSDAVRLNRPIMGAAYDNQFARTYRVVADELRKVARLILPGKHS